MLNLADIIESITGFRPKIKLPVITEATIDSRQVIPGALFAAIPGENVDGHDFIADAFNRGALFALTEKDVSGQFPLLDLQSINENELESLVAGLLAQPFCIGVKSTVEALQRIAHFWRRKLDLRVIGITGSVGKSTTKELVAEVLNQRYCTLKNPGNMNNEIGLPLTLLQVSSGHECAVLEMGFYVPGEIALLCDIALPQVGVVTNIGTVHAERAGSQEAIVKGKSELIHSLPPAPQGIAILNYDDPLVRPMAKITDSRIFYYGLDPKATLWADRVEGLGLDGIRFRLHYRKEMLHVRVPLIGQHSVHTALRATAVGLVEGLNWQEILEGLRSGHNQLRLVAVRSEIGALILDDTYNASPESTVAALNLLAELEGRRIAVLGDMLELGPYEKQGHELVGTRAAEVVDFLVTVGERGHMIAASALSAGLEANRIIEFEKADEAVNHLRKHLTLNDTVLIKGSHSLRMDQIVTSLEVQQ